MVKEVSLSKITTNGKCLFLAYDQGLEHGPSDFNDQNVDPNYIIDIAKKGKYNALIFQKGIAEKYRREIKLSKVPLVVKLNGKTNLVKGDPISEQICSVKEAIKLDAVAVGYTIYLGSKYESKMFAEFGKIEQEAHSLGIPVILWAYPRGESLTSRSDHEMLAYSCRIGLELGADIVKVHVKDLNDLAWAVQSAGKCKVVVAGGVKIDEGVLSKNVKKILSAGAMGLAIGRNVWQDDNPNHLTNKIKHLIWK